MMASVAGKIPVPFNTAYSASKHGLLGLTKSLAAEIAHSGYPGITVNAICPFFVKTEMFSGPEGYVAQIARATGASGEQEANETLRMSLKVKDLTRSPINSTRHFFFAILQFR